MARYKPIHKGMKLLPVDFDRQIQPGSNKGWPIIQTIVND
jgi:hypothetical protein